MSQDFSLRFDENKEQTWSNHDGNSSESDLYAQPGNSRTLLLQWSDGRKQFFNYNYLITGFCDPAQGIIRLEFSSHHVELRGQRLMSLYTEVMTQVRRVISCVEERYLPLNHHNDSAVTYIAVESR